MKKAHDISGGKKLWLTMGLVGLMMLWGLSLLFPRTIEKNPEDLSLLPQTSVPEEPLISNGAEDHEYLETQGVTVIDPISNPNQLSNPRQMELGIVTKKKPLDKESNVVLNDPSLSQKWGLVKSDALRAWNVTQGSKNITVAIIDTGIDENHPDLKDNLWINPGETGLDAQGNNKASNRIDDDGNGFIDDVHGWNFVQNNNNLADNHGHGTHIAGIIGAKGGNDIGISGVAPQVSLMILKYYDPEAPGTQNLENTVRAIRYAVQMKARIINYSGGGLEYSQPEYNAINEARKNNILVVAAAGNEQSNSDKTKYYPADYDLDNIISVTAIDPKTQVLPSSNYGIETVDIAAPGQDIYSTLPGGNYGMMTGTSQATAFVSGLGALILSNNDEYKPNQIKKYILATGDHEPQLRSKTGTSRRLNLYKALINIDSGVSVNGVIAENTRDIGPFSLNAPRGSALSSRSATFESTQNISLFGRSLLNTVTHQKSLGKN